MQNSINKAKNPFETQPIGKLIIKFAIPCVISLLVNALYNIVDQIFIGNSVGYLGNGATNVVFPITMFAISLAVLVGDGVAAFFSLKLGEKDVKKAAVATGNSVILLLIVSILVLIVFLVFLQPILKLLGATELIMPYAIDYGGIIVIGLPFMILSTGINSLIRVDGSPTYAMISMITGAVVNTVLDAIFIFSFNMGIKGAALATIIGQMVALIISLGYFKRFKNIKLDKSCFKLHKKTVKTFCSYGASSFITQFSIVIVATLVNNMLAIYGANSIYGSEIPLTALGIVMKVNQIMTSVLLGISIGSQPILGYNYGARKYLRVKSTLKKAMTACVCVAVVFFAMFQFMPDKIVAIFGSEDQLYTQFAVKCFRIFLMLCVIMSLQIVSSIYLQAIGKPLKAATLSLSRQILFLVPAAIILPYFFGVEGVLWAGPLADALALILTISIMIGEIKLLNRRIKNE